MVVLLWRAREDAVTLAVSDSRTGEHFEVPVAGETDYDAFDVLNDRIFRWRGGANWNYVEIDPAVTPAHVLRIGATVRPSVE